jgi:hypothetical protein
MTSYVRKAYVGIKIVYTFVRVPVNCEALR